MKKWKWIVLTLTGICLLLLFGSGGYVYHKASQTLQEVQVPVKASVETEKAVEQKKGLSFLLRGVKRTEEEFVRSTSLPRENDPAAQRSGTMLVPGKRCEANKAYARSSLISFQCFLQLSLNFFQRLIRRMPIVDSVRFDATFPIK